MLLLAVLLASSCTQVNGGSTPPLSPKLVPDSLATELLDDAALLLEDGYAMSDDGFVGMEDALAQSTLFDEERRASLTHLQEALQAQGLLNVDVPPDGSCQFHALIVSGGLMDMTTEELRERIVLYLGLNGDRFSPYVVGDWQEYLVNMSKPTCWGDHVTLLAAAELLGRPIVVHTAIAGGGEVTVHPLPDAAAAGEPPSPINLAFEHERHYQAVVAGNADVMDALVPASLGDDKCPLCTPAFRCAICSLRPNHGRFRLKSKTAAKDTVYGIAPVSNLERAVVLASSLGACRGQQRKQLKTCSRCKGVGHRVGSRKCPLRDVPLPPDHEPPRWLSKKKASKLLRSTRADPLQRTSAARARNLAMLLRRFKMQAKRPSMERPPWQPKYAREDSPRKKLHKVRREDRRTTDPWEVVEKTEGCAEEELRRLGFLRKWQGKACLICKDGSYGSLTARAMHRCGSTTCRKHVGVYRGSAWQGTVSATSARFCHSCAVGYAARLRPAQACIDKGLSRKQVYRMWRYFRAAEAQAGVARRAATVFGGTPECPAEVEVDEACFRKVPTYDTYTGERTGTMHHSAFVLTQRGSCKAVVYMLSPRFVPLRVDGAPAAVPPPGADEILPYLQTHVGDWCILHCDGARAYASLLEDLLGTRKQVFLDQVNHQGHQWTRFVRHAVEGCPGVARIRCVAGTNLVENAWHVLKHHAIPPEVRADDAVLEQYALAWLAREWETGDPVLSLGQIVHQYIEHYNGDPWSSDPCLAGEEEEDEEGDDLEREMREAEQE